MTDYHIEKLSDEDLAAVDGLRPADWGDIGAPHRWYLASQFCFPHKVQIEGKIVGIGTGIVFQNTGWLAHIIVDPDFRGRGIARALVSHIMNLLQFEQGCKALSLIATDLGYPVYKKAGFTDQATYLFFSRETVLVKPLKPNPAIRPVQDLYLSDLLALDVEISGEQRAHLLVDRLRHGLIYDDGAGLSGFYLPECGEGLIVARNSDAGLALLSMKMRISNKIMVPSANTIATSLLVKNGYSVVRKAERMVYGTPFAWKPEGLFSRVAGNLG